MSIPLTQVETAAEMTRRGYPMCKQRVGQIEKRSLEKMARDPELAKFIEDAGRLFRRWRWGFEKR